MSAGGRRAIPASAIATAIAVIFFAVYGFAPAAGHWHTNLPDRVFMELVPRSQEFSRS